MIKRFDMLETYQQPLPDIYTQLSDGELRLRIATAREQLGEKLVILGHHYQQDDIVAFADFSGDSFELSRRAAEQKDAKYVIFCGVHFMAESADILTAPDVQVILPDLSAGCSMADMANIDQTLECWEQLRDADPGAHLVPITYMNSTAAIKAFVGENGGAVCTSSNARKVLEWALAQAKALGKRPKVLFFPDQHLGRNTAWEMGYKLSDMLVWDPERPMGGNTPQSIGTATFILWKGHCSVHQLFKPEHIDETRAEHPGIRVIVHPECAWEVVQKADESGSTAKIVKVVEAAPPGSKWAIGTEVHLVNRLAKKHPDKTVVILSGCQCLCSTMYRIDLPHLCWAIENLAQGRVVNEIRVDERTRAGATLALSRMLQIA
jgi:quinolinate synthase